MWSSVGSDLAELHQLHQHGQPSQPAHKHVSLNKQGLKLLQCSAKGPDRKGSSICAEEKQLTWLLLSRALLPGLPSGGSQGRGTNLPQSTRDSFQRP